MYDVTLISDTVQDGIRKTSFQTCDVVCSMQIDIETEGDLIRRVQYTKGCHGNTQGLARLCEGMKVSDVITRLEGIDCKGRGTSCPDQLARALSRICAPKLEQQESTSSDPVCETATPYKK